MLTLLGEEIQRFGACQAAGIEIAAEGGLVAEFNDDFLVRRGWGSRLQRKSPYSRQESVEIGCSCMLC
jgi:hypothetical protein